MMKEKLWSVFFLSMFCFSFVSAASYGGLGSGLGHGVEQLIDIVEEMGYPFFSTLLGGESGYLFEKFLFLIILISVIYLVLTKVPMFSGNAKHERAIRWIITITISLLATRFMVESELIKTMILPYTALGVTLTAVLPMLVYFYFVTKGFSGSENSFLRKVLWIAFGVVFIGIWGSRYDQLGSISWIYFWTGLLAFVFFLFDGTIQQKMRVHKMSLGRELVQQEHIAKLIGQLKSHRDQRDAWTDKRAWHKREVDLEDEIKRQTAKLK